MHEMAKRGKEYEYQKDDRTAAIKRRRELVMRMQEMKRNFYPEQIEEEEAAWQKRNIRPKLEISKPEDKHEQEADHISRKAVSGEHVHEVNSTSSGIQKKHDKEESGPLMAKGEDGGLKGTSELQTQLDASKGSGQSLDDKTKSEMESKMGANLGDVKIHTGTNAHEMAEGINAKAFTHGQDIYFKNGNYNTNSSDGKELLAHELAHTQQQKDGVERKVQRQADTSGSKALQSLGTLKIPKIEAEPTKEIPIMQNASDKEVTNVGSTTDLSYDPSIHNARLHAEAYEEQLEYQREIDTEKEKYQNRFNKLATGELDIDANGNVITHDLKKETKKHTPTSHKQDELLLNLITQLNDESKRDLVIIQLGNMPDKGGWNILLNSYASNDEKLKASVSHYFSRWIKSKDGFLDYLIGVANGHQSVLAAYATQVLIDNEYSANVDKKAYIDALTSKLGLSRIEFDKITAIVKKTGDNTSGMAEGFNNTLNKKIATLPQEDLNIIAKIDAQASDMLLYLRLATSSLSFLSAFCTRREGEERKGVSEAVHPDFSDVVDAAYKLSYSLNDYGQDMKGYAIDDLTKIFYSRWAKKTIRKYDTKAKSDVDAAIMSELSGSFAGIIKNLDQIGKSVNGMNVYLNMGDVFGRLNKYRLHVTALQQLLPTLSDMAKSNPAAFYKFWISLRPELYKISVGIYSMGPALTAHSVYATYAGSNFLSWGAALFGGPGGAGAAYEYRMQKLAAITPILTACIGDVLNADTNPAASYDHAQKESMSPYLQSLVDEAHSFANVETAFNYVMQTIVAIAIVLLSIETAGAALELLSLLPAIEVLGTATAGGGVTAGVLGEAALSLGVESLSFLVMQKSITGALYGDKAAGWDRFGKDFIETAATFGTLGALGKGFKSFEAGAKFTGVEKSLWTVTKFGIENVAFVSLNALFTAIENYFLPPDKQKDFDAIAEFGNSVVFLLGMRLGMMARIGLPSEVPGIDEVRTELDPIGAEIESRILELKNRSMSPDEQAGLQKDIAGLWRKKARLLEDAKASETDPKKQKKIEAAVKLFYAKALEAETGGMARFNIRASMEAPNTFLFEGSPAELKKEILRSEGKAKFDQSPREKNIWIYTDGKGNVKTMMNVLSTAEFTPRLGSVLKEKSISGTPEDIRTKFWEGAGQPEMATVEGSDRIVADAIRKGWDPVKPESLTEIMKIKAERFNRTQKDNKLYEKFKEDYKKVDPTVRDLIYKTPLEALDNVLPQVDTTKNLNRLGKLFPDFTSIFKIEDFKPDYVQVKTKDGGDSISKIDNAPLIDNPGLVDRVKSNPAQYGVLNEILNSYTGNKIDLQSRINALSDKGGLNLYFDLQGRMNVDQNELITRAEKAVKSGYSADQTVAFYEAQDISSEINKSQDFQDLLKERKSNGLFKGKSDRYSAEKKTLEDSQTKLKTENPEDPTVTRQNLQNVKSKLTLEISTKKLGEKIREKGLKGNPFQYPEAYNMLVETVKDFVNNGGTDANTFAEFLESSGRIKKVKWERKAVKEKIDKAFSEGKKQIDIEKQSSKVLVVKGSLAKGLTRRMQESYDKLVGSGLKPREQEGAIKFFTEENVFVAEISDGKLIFKYSGFGGDLVMDIELTTTILGKFEEIKNNPYLGTRYFLGDQKNGIKGLPEGSFTRGKGGESNPNGMNFLDLPNSEYQAILDKNIQKYIDKGFEESLAGELGEIDGKREFWLNYNLPFLEAAFKRGDNVRLISNPSPEGKMKYGTYELELNTIERILAIKYGYVYDFRTYTYKKK